MGVGKDQIVLTSKDRKALESWVDRPGVPLRLIIRAWIILLSASGNATSNIASRLGVCASTVLYWRSRFIRGGVDGISEKKNFSRKRHSNAEIQKIIEATRKEFPRMARRWSVRNMAEFMGVSRSAVQRIWKSHGLAPFEEESAPPEADMRFYESCRDVAGVYVQSSQIYAVALLTGPDPDLPAPQTTQPAPRKKQMLSAVPRLSVLFQTLLRILSRRRSVTLPNPDLLEFLKWVDSQTPPSAVIHLIVPRPSLQLSAHTFRWLKRHPKFQRHLIPNDVIPAGRAPARRFLAEWAAKTVEMARTRKTFPNLPDMEVALEDFIRQIPSGPRPQPFFWVRPDRNYLSDERQLELNLMVA